MKLLRHGDQGHERPGIVDQDGHIRDLSSLINDIDGTTLSEEKLAWLSRQDFASLPIVPDSTRLGPCVGNVGNIICIGLNYEDHAREANLPIPEEPVIFMKSTSAISGPYDDVIRPRGSDKMDWEAEQHIAGYCIANDLSERAFQFERGGQWDKGKSCNTFAPIGPWVVTRDEAGDMSDRAIWLAVNDHRYQDGTTAYMIFRPAFIVHYVSQFMTLMPGDIVITGTPPGVGFGLTPPVYLQPGDVMTLGIEGLGQQQTKVIEAPA